MNKAIHIPWNIFPVCRHDVRFENDWWNQHQPFLDQGALCKSDGKMMDGKCVTSALRIKQVV